MGAAKSSQAYWKDTRNFFSVVEDFHTGKNAGLLHDILNL